MIEPHPYRHVVPTRDGQSLLWLTDLHNPLLTPAPEIAALVGRPVKTPAEEAVLSRLLQACGFLRPADWEPEPAAEDVGEGYVLLDACDLRKLRQASRTPGRTTVYGLRSDGKQAWIYACRHGVDPCVDCFLGRWLAGLDGGEALQAFLELEIPLTFAPVLSAEAWRRASAEAVAGRVTFYPEPQHLACLPLPGCSQCRPAGESPPELWLGHRLGVVQKCRLWPGQTRLPVVGTSTGDTRRSTGRLAYNTGAGCALTEDEARRAAVGEALERYAASFLRDLEWAPFEAGDRRIFPDAFTARQYALPEFPCRPVRQGERIPWVCVRDLANDSRGRAPADAVFMAQDALPGPSIDPGLSHGLAAGSSLSGALQSALWEKLERDAIAVWWLHGPCADQVRLPLPEGYPLQGLEAVLLACPALISWAVVCLLRDELGRITTGSAAGPGADRRALQEALHNREFLLRHPDPAAGPSPTSFVEHLRGLWHDPAPVPFKLWVELEPESLPDWPTHSAATLATRLARMDFRCWWFDLTTPDVRSAGYHVVRVLAPELVYIPARHDAWPLNLCRCRERFSAGPARPHIFG